MFFNKETQLFLAGLRTEFVNLVEKLHNQAILIEAISISPSDLTSKIRKVRVQVVECCLTLADSARTARIHDSLMQTIKQITLLLNRQPCCSH